jgi:hypothetical protein
MPVSRKARCHARDQLERVGSFPLRVRKSRSSGPRSWSSNQVLSMLTSTGGTGTDRGPVFATGKTQHVVLFARLLAEKYAGTPIAEHFGASEP